MLISSLTIQNGTSTTRLMLFYLQLGLVCTKKHRFVGYTPKKRLNGFQQSAVATRIQGDENPNSCVVAKTKKLLGSFSYGYHIMDGSQHTITKCLSDEKTQADYSIKLLNRLDHLNNSLSEVELAKAQSEDNELIIVRFFSFQYAKLQCWDCITTFPPVSVT